MGRCGLTIKASNLGHVNGTPRKNASARLRAFKVSPGRYEIGDYLIWRPNPRKSGSCTRWLVDFRGKRLGQRRDLEGADQLRVQHAAAIIEVSSDAGL